MEVLETGGGNLALEALRIEEADPRPVICMMISHKKAHQIRIR